MLGIVDWHPRSSYWKGATLNFLGPIHRDNFLGPNKYVKHIIRAYIQLLFKRLSLYSKKGAYVQEITEIRQTFKKGLNTKFPQEGTNPFKIIFALKNIGSLNPFSFWYCLILLPYLRNGSSTGFKSIIVYTYLIHLEYVAFTLKWYSTR